MPARGGSRRWRSRSQIATEPFREPAASPAAGLVEAQADDGDRRFPFGRSAMIQELAVVGASGSGKTSLVQAGLLARLAAEKEPAGERVRPVVIRPGPRPLQSLAAEFARLAKDGDARAVLAAARSRRAIS